MISFYSVISNALLPYLNKNITKMKQKQNVNNIITPNENNLIAIIVFIVLAN